MTAACWNVGNSVINELNDGERGLFNGFSTITSILLFQSGSCESLVSRDKVAASVPGHLDKISSGSTADINVVAEEESSVPNILTVCFRHLEAHGLHTLGIFRVSTSKKRIRQVKHLGRPNSARFSVLFVSANTLMKYWTRVR